MMKRFFCLFLSLMLLLSMLPASAQETPAPFEVLEKGDEWTHVRIGELEGYMRTEYLDFKSPWPASGMPVMEIYNPGPLANMKLRLAPDMNAEYAGVYKNGTKVIMMGFTAEWAHVICDGKMGFMRTEFLK